MRRGLSGIGDAEPTCSYASNDAVAQCFQSIGARLIPSVARLARSALLAGEELGHSERRVALQHVIDRPRELVGQDRQGLALAVLFR
jgi:hypothetical protein